MNREVLITYGKNKAEIKRLEDENKFMQQAIETEIKGLIEKPGDEYISLPELDGIGKYSLVKAKAKWKFGSALQDVEDELKQMKENEIALGKALNLNEGKTEVRFIQSKQD